MAPPPKNTSKFQKFEAVQKKAVLSNQLVTLLGTVLEVMPNNFYKVEWQHCDKFAIVPYMSFEKGSYLSNG